MNRIFHTWDKWECYPAGFYEDHAPNGVQKSDAESAYAEFLRDTPRFAAALERVLSEWPNSCENALTDYSINRKAWVGHAAVALAHGIPEDITRLAWGKLTDEQRLLANKEAERAIQHWEYHYQKSNGLYPDMGSALLC